MIGQDMFRAPNVPIPTTSLLAAEAWIADRLCRRDLFAGITTPEERRERVRAAVLDGRIIEAIAGKREGKPCETWGELFLRLYGQAIAARSAA